jgi:hypothetical protein
MCAGCHKITDPIGLALENFDASGVSRTVENGAAIDPSGEFNGKPFKNFAEFAQIIKEEPGTTACVISRAFSYGTQRMPTGEDQEWLNGVQQDLRAKGVKWRELMRRITLNPAFYTVQAGETQKADARH